MPQEPQLIAPRNRGRFSDREQWENIHWDRVRRYAAGERIRDIAAKHGVKPRAVHYSIEQYLSRMPTDEANAIRAERWKRTARGRYEWEWIFREIERLQRQQSRLWRLLGSMKF
jgi:hypothetical protein